MRASRVTGGGAASGVAVAVLAMAALLQPPHPQGGEPPGRESWQVARYTPSYQSRWRDDSADNGAELDVPMRGPKGPGIGRPSTTGPGGYDAQRSRRFWSNFQFRRPEKDEPLERPPRGEAP